MGWGNFCCPIPLNYVCYNKIMKINYKFSKIPTRCQKNYKELEEYMSQYDIARDLISRFFPEIGKDVNIEVWHKALKQDARFYKDTIYLNFANNISYLWAGLCHESAHILLRQAGWEKTNTYKELKKKKIHYEVDQSCAILIQAYYENLAGIRKLKWNDWQQTFAGMGVEKIGKPLFEKFVQDLDSKKRFSILEFVS